ncbi:MAG TPA: flagellar biosynthetic protein FliO [Burkholderiaceae bacterium]|nr:flagellar biosynthetic protein FliO [Burkholderiaceae bacterium]
MQDAPSVWPALLAFAGVIALIPLALWMLKRVQGGGTAGRRAVTLVGGLALGPRERIAIVEAQGRRWMVGVTGQSISLLAELDASVPATAAAAPVVDAAQAFPANPFAQLLDRLKRHG